MKALLEAVEAKTVAPADLDPVRRRQLLDHPDRGIRDRASRLFAAEPGADRARVIVAYRKALTLDGDRARGRTVFLKGLRDVPRGRRAGGRRRPEPRDGLGPDPGGPPSPHPRPEP